MRIGIRVQLLLALGSLLVVAFVPLFFAVASLTHATFGGSAAVAMRAHARSAGAFLVECGPVDGRQQEWLERHRRATGMLAVGIYGSTGELEQTSGERDYVTLLPQRIELHRDAVRTVGIPTGSTVLAIAVVPHGAVGVVARAPAEGGFRSPLVRLVALYTGTVAVALLVFAYFSLTHLIVRPIETLSASAQRVAGGSRKLHVPHRGGEELVELGRSLSRMTERLRNDEQALKEELERTSRYAEELTRVQDQIVRAERLASVGRLAAGLAHEIGNPLASILGFQDLLLDGGLAASEEREFLTRMRRETVRISNILRNLLDFARPANPMGELGRAVPQEPGDVAAAVRDAVQLVDMQESFKGVEVRVELASDLPPVVLSRERLVQVLLNLLLNAGSAVDPSRGRIVVRVGVSAGAEGRARDDGRSNHVVRIEVEDNGPGVAPEVQASLFEPFVTTKPVGQGTGLGLAVSRGLVESAAGTIALDSHGGGARFVIELPSL